MRLTTRQITLAGLLAAAALALGSTGLGYIPVPTAGGALTIMQVPAILAGVLAGPLAGALVGGVFGAFSLARFAPPDPVVQLLPRVLIGVVAWAVYVGMLRAFPTRWKLAAGTAAAVATVFHTSTVLALAVLRGWFPLDVVLVVGVVHGPLEAVLASFLTVPVVAAARRLRLASSVADLAPKRI